MRGRATTRQHLKRDGAAARAQWLRAAELVATATGVALSEITLRAPDGRAWHAERVFARRAAYYLTVTALDVPAARLARALGRPRWRVSEACQKIELARDRADVEQFLSRMEAMLR